MITLSDLLLKWYATNGREMPWRVRGGSHHNPYHVWISEIMLQQTTVSTVKTFFEKWIKRFPDIPTLAAADLQEVLLYWQGLGYYTRAKKILECAKILHQEFSDTLPNTRAQLLKLPGIGPYSASSICAFAFNQSETVVDTNVIRVIARLYGIQETVDKDKIYPLAHQITPQKNGGDYASAIMDLGAMICTVDTPKCLLCPWQKKCKAYQQGIQSEIPKIKKIQKENRTGSVFLIFNTKNQIYIRKRTEKGLLSGLFEFPWNYENVSPATGRIKQLSTHITHTFTHFHLDLTVYSVKNASIKNTDGIFVSIDNLKDYPFSTLMKKVIKVLDNKENR